VPGFLIFLFTKEHFGKTAQAYHLQNLKTVDVDSLLLNLLQICISHYRHQNDRALLQKIDALVLLRDYVVDGVELVLTSEPCDVRNLKFLHLVLNELKILNRCQQSV